MGPSGSGKTTLLNVLAQRKAATNATVQGKMSVDGSSPPSRVFRQMSSYVEQEDALIGSLTVRETIDFAARLALPSYVASAHELPYLRRPQHICLRWSLVDGENVGMSAAKNGFVVSTTL